MVQIDNPADGPPAGDATRADLRAHCLRARETLSADRVGELSAIVCRHLLRQFAAPPATSIGFCWPVRGEADVRPAVLAWLGQGATLALPRIRNKGQPLDFHAWQPGDPLQVGAFGIPEPETDRPLWPACLLLPMVGFDAAGFRLGYGAGYFDRTLAVCQPRPLLIGVAFELSRLESVRPQAHDVPVDLIATEAGVFRAARRP